MLKPPNLSALFLGMSNATSIAVLDALLAAGVDVRGVVVAAQRASAAPIAQVMPAPNQSLLPIANPFVEHTIVQVAWARGIPAFEISCPGAPETLARLAELRPDVACVACFPRRLPTSLLALPRLGFLNMHPALLPAHRGPEPLFWTFRNGERATGVTIHFMDQALDTGDIAIQESFELPDGISGPAAERHAAALGGQLMVATLHALRDGTLARRPQRQGGSYEPSPSLDDWRISTDWTARRAFNFMRGTAEWGQPYVVDTGGAELTLAAALGYDDNARLRDVHVRVGDQVRIRFAVGVLRARVG